MLSWSEKYVQRRSPEYGENLRKKVIAAGFEFGKVYLCRISTGLAKVKLIDIQYGGIYAVNVDTGRQVGVTLQKLKNRL